MKSRSQEINVFSMSALDLFASALGAFILISIVLMPYFLRPKYQFPNLDIVMALDTTGSMGGAGRRSTVGDRSTDAPLLSKLSPSLGVGVIDFKDRCEGANAVREFALRRMDAAGLRALVSFTRTMSAGGSACNRDSTGSARQRAGTRPLDRAGVRKGESRVIVIITDNPAYEDRKAHALDAARSFAVSRRRSKVSVVLRGDDEAFLRRLAAAGNGEFIRAGASFTATVVLALAS